MRNLAEYPVTDAEIFAALKALRASLIEAAQGRPGDIRPSLIDAAVERIVQHPRQPEAMAINRPYATQADRCRP